MRAALAWAALCTLPARATTTHPYLPPPTLAPHLTAPPARRPSPPMRSASYDNTVRLWDAATGSTKAILARHTAMVMALGWSPDGSLLATGSSDRAVHVWSSADGRLVRSFTAPAGVFDVAFSVDGKELAAACADGTVAVLTLRG